MVKFTEYVNALVKGEGCTRVDDTYGKYKNNEIFFWYQKVSENWSMIKLGLIDADNKRDNNTDVIEIHEYQGPKHWNKQEQEYINKLGFYFCIDNARYDSIIISEGKKIELDTLTGKKIDIWLSFKDYNVELIRYEEKAKVQMEVPSIDDMVELIRHLIIDHIDDNGPVRIVSFEEYEKITKEKAKIAAREAEFKRLFNIIKPILILSIMGVYENWLNTLRRCFGYASHHNLEQYAKSLQEMMNSIQSALNEKYSEKNTTIGK